MNKRVIFIISISVVAFYIIGRNIYDPWFDSTTRLVHAIWGSEYTIVARPEFIAYPYERFGLYFTLIPLSLFALIYFRKLRTQISPTQTIISYIAIFVTTFFLICYFQYLPIFAVKDFFVNGKDLSPNARNVDLNLNYFICLVITTVSVFVLKALKSSRS